MDEKIKHLAKCRQIAAKYRAEVDELEAKLEDFYLWRWLEQRRSLVSIAKADVKDAEADVRLAALRVYAETDDTAPHPAVKIKLYTVLEYNADKALVYARKHLPRALKLDKRIFERAAKAIELSFVTIMKEPRATITRDLSEWLADEMKGAEGASK